MIQLGPPSSRHPAENLAQISKNAPKEIKANRVALSEIRLKRPRSKHHLEAGFAEISRGSSNPAVSRRAVCKGCAMRKETTLPDIIRRLGSRPVSPSCVNPFGQTNSGITICLVKNRDTLALCPLRADTPTSRLLIAVPDLRAHADHAAQIRIVRHALTQRWANWEIAFVSYWELAKVFATALGVSTVTTAVGISLWWWLMK